MTPRLGSIFEKKFKKDPRTMTLEEINELAAPNPQYRKYGSDFVSKRGDVFENRSLGKSINQLLDDLLKR
jgi:hypothetical protein